MEHQTSDIQQLKEQAEEVQENIREQLSELVEQFQEFQREFQVKAREEIKKLFQKFWELNPGVNAVIWTQYAPYFNDGEPCEFNVYDPTFTNATGYDINDIVYDMYDGEKEEVWAETLWGLKYREESREGVNRDSLEAIAEMLCSGSLEDTMKAMFGTDSRVIATRDGFEVEDYGGSHD